MATQKLATSEVTSFQSTQQSRRLSLRARLSTLISVKEKSVDPELERQRTEYQAWQRVQPTKDRGPNLSFACERDYVLLIHDLIKRHGSGPWIDQRSVMAALKSSPKSPAMEIRWQTSRDDANSPLEIAAQKGHRECVKALLSYADVAEFPTIVSAIRDAGDRNDLEMLRLLLCTTPARHNYQGLPYQSGMQRTIFRAVEQKRYQIALELLQFEFELNTEGKAAGTMIVTRDSSSQAALIAILTEKEDDSTRKNIANLLIMKGALQSRPGFIIAKLCVSDDMAALKYLLNHTGWEQRGLKKASAVQTGFYQAMNEHKISQDVVDVLLEHGLDVNEKDEHGYTILHRSVIQYDHLNFEKLLEHGGQPDIKNRSGQTVAEVALIRKKSKILQALIDRDVSLLDAQSQPKKQTYLMQAAQVGWTEGVDILLQAGAVTDEVDCESSTALHLAAAGGHSEVVQMLLEAGADAALPNENDLFPIHLAVMAGSWACYCNFLKFDTSYIQGEYHKGLFIVSMGPPQRDQTNFLTDVLRRFPINVDSIRDPDSDAPPLFWVARDGKANVVRVLLAHGADPNCKTNSPSIVVLALSEHHDAVARQLLEGGADFRWTTGGKANFNLLHIACKEGAYETAAFLLRKKISANATTADGFLPLHLVIPRDDARMARLLLSHGANIHLSRRGVPSPLDLAQRHDSTRILSLF